jgi:hypothetical protein
MRALPRDLAAALVADNPRGQTERLITTLIDSGQAKGAAVLIPEPEDQLSVFLAAAVSVEPLAGATALWRTGRDELAAGFPRTSGRHTLVPLRENGDLHALLYLEDAQGPPGDFEWYALVLTKAVQAAHRPPQEPLRIEDYFASSRQADVQKRHLVDALNRNEWNIARVARVLGVTRRTIYLRLKRFNIAREKVSKKLVRAGA